MSGLNAVRDLQITLIDQNEQFVFKPLLYELINGGAKPEEVAPLFADLLAPMTSTSFVQVRLATWCMRSSMHAAVPLGFTSFPQLATADPAPTSSTKLTCTS